MLNVTIFSSRRNAVGERALVEGGMSPFGPSCASESSGVSVASLSCFRFELPRWREGPALSEGRSPAVV